MEEQEAAGRSNVESQLTYKIERPVYDEDFIQTELLHRKDRSTTLRQRLAQRLR